MVFQSQQRDSWCFGHGATHHLTGECFETWLAAQRIKPPIDLDAAEDPGVEGRAIFVALFQQPQCFLFIAQRQVDHGERIGRDITLPGYSCQIVEYLARLFFPPRQALGPGERGLNSWVGTKLHGFLIF